MDTKDQYVIGVDMGATKINVGLVSNNEVQIKNLFAFDSQQSQTDIISDLMDGISELMTDSVVGIGIGVPSLVDVETGTVYDVQNIPSWKEVPLKKLLEERYNIPVCVNNDANCFAIGEKYFGAGKDIHNFVGLTLGTGLGGGIVIHDQLYSGRNCGAGEFGSVPYKDYIFESYCSGKFFKNDEDLNGKIISERARKNDPEAISIFNEYGTHLGELILTVLYSLDPDAILLGGSVCHDFKFFEKSMWEKISEFPYKRSIERLQILPSALVDSAVLGAAALYFDAIASGKVTPYRS